MLSHVCLFVTPDCSMPSSPVLPYLSEFAQTHVHWVDDAMQPSHPLTSPSPPAFNLSQNQGSLPMSWFFSSGSQSIGALALASVLPMSIQGWFFFRMDWLDLLAVQGTLKSLLQHHSSKALVLRHSASFVVHLLHQYMTTGKTITLTIWTFVGKAMSLLFSTLSRFVVAFLPRNKRLLISWLQSLSAV